MIIDAEIINQPYSGQYTERVYDYESPWNSQSWSYIIFKMDDFSELCGQFRGLAKQVLISKIYNIVLVLTSDHLFQLDIKTGNIMEIENQPQYKNMTLAPNGCFILSDNFTLVRIAKSIKQTEIISSSIEMDNIEFKKWDNSKLEFICDEFLNWERHLTMLYDIETNKIEIKCVAN